jgi:hypothetical protein
MIFLSRLRALYNKPNSKQEDKEAETYKNDLTTTRKVAFDRIGRNNKRNEMKAAGKVVCRAADKLTYLSCKGLSTIQMEALVKEYYEKRNLA